MLLTYGILSHYYFNIVFNYFNYWKIRKSFLLIFVNLILLLISSVDFYHHFHCIDLKKKCKSNIYISIFFAFSSRRGTSFELLIGKYNIRHMHLLLIVEIIAVPSKRERLFRRPEAVAIT